MVLPEGADEGLPDERRIRLAEVVGEEVHETGDEVRGEEPGDRSQREPPSEPMLHRPVEDAHREVEGQGDEDDLRGQEDAHRRRGDGEGWASGGVHAHEKYARDRRMGFALRASRSGSPSGAT